MSERFLQLPAADRREALGVAVALTGRPLHLLDKDVWLVWTLEVLFQTDFASHLVFKGGSSLSKAHRIIDRFSEDVDLTYDIRALAPDLVEAGEEPLPPTRSQEKRWTKEIRSRLPAWVSDRAAPAIRAALAAQSLPARISPQGDVAFIEYEPLATGTGYTRPAIMLEFGARSTGEPCERRPVRCDAADCVAGVEFPAANPRVMRPERTFWEKATAIHVYCAQGEFRGGNRFARHWHDLTRLVRSGAASNAIGDRELAMTVARHKSAFFAEKNVDYAAAVSGALRLIPDGAAFEALAADYARMVEDGLLSAPAESFEEIMDSCLSLQDRANRRRAAHA